MGGANHNFRKFGALPCNFCVPTSTVQVACCIMNAGASPSAGARPPMGSKSPPPDRASRAAASEDDPFDRRVPPPGTGRLLQRIAEALQIPATALYTPRGGGRNDATAGEAETEALLRAFRRIDDPQLRRRLLILTQGLAERG